MILAVERADLARNQPTRAPKAGAEIREDPAPDWRIPHR